jgi:transcriptional regulator with XRE-family HTH domain
MSKTSKKVAHRQVAASRRVVRRFRTALSLAGISQRELAGLAGVASGGPGALLRGEIPYPSFWNIAQLARVLGLSLDWLAWDQGTAPTKDSVRAAVERAKVTTPVQPAQEAA